MQTGEKLLVLVDYYPKFPVIEISKNTDSRTVINRLDSVFSLFGFPQDITTDNGPPWNSYEIKKYFEDRNMNHIRITPLLPRSNGQAERFMRMIKKTIQDAINQQVNWREALKYMLLNYRNTSHPATNEKPSTLFYGREINAVHRK